MKSNILNRHQKNSFCLNTKSFLLFFLFAHLFAFSQIEEVKNYEWEAVPKFNEIPKEFENYPAVVLKDYRLYENRIGSYTYKGFVVKHCAIKILTNEGVNNFNKVSIDKKYVRDYRDIRARVIKENGTIEELPKERIIEKENSDERQFVFEGVEKGDIIEYFYVIKDFPVLSGVEYFQRTIPVIEGKFQINEIPNTFTYAYGYNGMTEASTQKYKIFVVKNLAAYQFETNATNYANLAKVHYFTRVFSYGFQDFFRDLNYYADGTNAKTMVKEFITDLKLDDITIPLDERLKKMDIYIKTNLELDYQPSYKKVFEDKKITPKMVLNLYKDVLDYLNIKYNLIASTDKFEDRFDEIHVVPQTLSEIMIYIPETNKRLTPFNYWIPYGPASNVCINNTGVMFRTEGKNNKNVYYDFVTIDSPTVDENLVKTNSNITIDENMEMVNVNKKMETTGYRSYYSRYYMKYVTEDKLKDYIKENVFQDINVDIKNYTISNKEYEFNYDNTKPFTFDAQVQIKESWIENAGKNYIFSIGKVIGKQTDLYQEKERKYAVDLYYPKKYIHTITLNIPNGYTIKNIDNLIFNKQLKDDENKEIIGSFTTIAKIEGNTLKISIEEFYNFTHLEKERYNEYRDLINTAFDFYKSSVVISK
jgi:hypothetical protein